MKISSNFFSLAVIWKRIFELVINPYFTREIGNWQRLLADFIWPKTGTYTLKLRNNGQLILRGNTFDKWPVSEVIVRDDYRLRSQPSPPDTIIDLGAGIGDFCVYACLLYPKVKIFAYEPDSETFEILEQNIKLNSLTDKVFAHKQAVTKKDSPKKQYINQTKGFAELVNRYPADQLMSTTTLEEIFLYNNIKQCDLLKIDIEGAEYAVLYSLSPALFKKISRIYLECHNFDATEFNDRNLRRLLESYGYQVEVRKNLDKHISMVYAYSTPPSI